MFNSADRIADIDPELAQAIEAEKRRQEEHIELIASEKDRKTSCRERV